MSLFLYNHTNDRHNTLIYDRQVSFLPLSYYMFTSNSGIKYLHVDMAPCTITHTKHRSISVVGLHSELRLYTSFLLKLFGWRKTLMASLIS